MSKFTKIGFKFLDLLVIFIMTFASPISVLADPSPTGATIASDLADYPPGATVTLTGTGWAAAEDVHIVVNDTIGQTWKRDVTVKADDFGNLTDVFSLPNYFVSDYDVTATGPVSGAATTTFTDAAGSSSKPYAHWSDEPLPGDWNNNILNANKSNYFEGEVIPHVFIYEASNSAKLENGHSYSFNVTYNWYQQNTDAGGFAYMTQYNLSRQPTAFDWATPAITPIEDNSFTNNGGMHAGSFFTVDANITDVSAVTYTGTGTKDGHVTITFTYTGVTIGNGGYAAIYYGLYIAKPGEVPDQGAGKTNGANAWSGGSLQTTVDIGGSGATSLQLAPDAIIAGEISGLKFNDLNGNGAKDAGEPGLAGWTICLDSDSDPNNGNLGCVQTANGTTDDLDGNGVVDPVGFYYFSVTPGTYWVFEVNQSGWTQTAPSSVIFGPLVVSATTPTFLNQNFGNTFNTGSLKLTKSLNGGPTGYAGPFTINYDCDGTAYDGSVQVNAGSSQTVSGIPTGTSCTISETLPNAPAGYSFGTPTFSPSATVTIGNGTTVEVTTNNTLTRDTGTLTITKTLSNPNGASVPSSFTINYDCGTGYTGTVSVAAGGSQTVSGIPTGSTCTVSEAALAPIPGYTWGTPTVTPASVVIADTTGTFTLTVANSITRDTGSLQVNKTLNDGGSGFSGNFSINYDCGGGLSGSLTVPPGGSSTVTGIPTGSSCTVTEPTLPAPPTGYSWGTPVITGSPAAITTNGATVEVTVANSLTRDLGNFKITKNTSNPDGATLPTFTGTYDCGTGYTGTWSVADGGSQTVTGIPTGNTCSVTEDALASISGYTWGTPTFTPSSIVISTKGGTFEIVVGNSITRDRGSFKITKTTSNPDGATLPTFTGTYDCGTGYAGTWSVADGGSQTVNGIPTGNTCTVTEDVLAPISGYTWGTPTFTPSSIVITSKGGTFEIVVGNSITRDLGNFKITKQTSNPDGATLPTFTGTYNCGAGYTGTWSVADGGSQTVSGIPTGNTCSVNEDPLAPISGYTWGTPTFTPASIVISSKGGTFEIVVGNSITRDRGNFKITKTTSNPDGATLPASFTGTYDCGAGYTGTWSVANGGSQTVTGIPTGNTCSVTEDALSPISGYTWGAPTFTPSSIVISSKDGTFTITVGNSITRDRGSLEIKKTLSNPDGANVPASFTVNYDCGAVYTGSVSVAPGSPATVNGIPTGSTCTVTEVAPAAIPGYTWGTITYTPASVNIDTKGGTFTITVGNSITRDTGSLKITKSIVGAPDGFTDTFSVDVVCTGDGGSYNNQSISYPTPGYVTITGIPTGNTCTVTEDTPSGAPTGYSWGTVVISGSPATITKNGTAEVTVTNTVTGRAKVIKTKAGLALSGTDAFIFQLREGASTTQLGTILETQTANVGNSGVINFTTVLVPGQHYQLCELVMPGWNTSLQGILFVPGSIIPPTLPNPNVDNSPVCVDFVAQAGVTTTFTVDNTFPGGLARTIGFWKNWASCASSNGKGQKPVLDQTLAQAEPTGIVVSATSGTYPAFGPTLYLVLHDTNPDPNVASDCLKAVRLLDKSTIDTNKKMASDPAFNLAAQLVAAELNFTAGAAKNGTVIAAVNQAVLLLGKYKFDGKTHTKLSAADATTMNNLAKILDDYNNNR